MIELVVSGKVGMLFSSMLKEEWRLQRSFVGSFGAFFFPLVILLFSLVLVLIFPFNDLESSSLVDIIHVIMFLYGLGVGGIALIGEQVMARRIGQVNLLIKLPQLQPLSFRKIMVVFYLKEVLFYHLYSMIPFGLGLVIGGFLSGLSILGTLMVAMTVALVFTLGMSLSFLISGALVRSRSLGIFSVITLVLICAVSAGFGLVEPVQLLHPLYFYREANGFWLVLSILEILVLSVAAVLIMKERVSLSSRRYKSSLLELSRSFWGNDRKRTLLAKEWLELRRSGTFWPVIIGFIGPLLAVYGMVYLFTGGLDLDIDFNVVFYSALIGFFGVMTYSWLNNVEPNESFNVLPVTVGEIIDVKLGLYMVFTTLISTFYIAAIGVIEGDLLLIPVGILVGLSTNIYVAFVTARLTGLRTNSMLLDAVTLSKFSLLIVPPLIFLVIGSFQLENGGYLPLVVITIFSTVLTVIGFLFRKNISRRWDRERFSI